MFAFRQQPLKAVYIAYSLLVVVAKLPYWILVSAPLSWRPRPNWTLSRSVTLRFIQTAVDVAYATGLFIGEDVEKSARSANKLGFVWIEPLLTGFLRGEIASMAIVNETVGVRIYGYWYGEDVGDGSHGGKAQLDEKVLYHLHGGAYIMGSASPVGMFGTFIANYVKECAAVVKRAFCLNYRLSSAPPFAAENAFPAALLDALAGYRYLVELGFSTTNIIVSGDSAGGHLAFSLVRYLAQEATSTLHAPGAVILLSPAGDWAGTHDASPNSSMTRNARSDATGMVFQSGYTARALRGNLPEDSIATNHWISPSSLQIDTRGLFKAFPPTIITAGGAEQMLDHIKTLYNRLQVDNDADRIKYAEYPDASHDPIMVPNQQPEQTECAKEVGRWLGTVYGEPGRPTL